MVILDTNAILRYILNDNENMALEVEKIINGNDTFVTIEVIAEVVYVLKSVYKVEKQDIVRSLLCFIDEVIIYEKEVLIVGINTYAKQNLDFIDCVLYGYKCVKQYDVFTFDKKLKKLISERL